MAGVQNTALRLANAASDTVLHHMSLGNFDSGNTVHKDGTDVWATPMYGNIYTHGMNVSDDSVVGNYGGLAIGADTEIGSEAACSAWALPCTAEPAVLKARAPLPRRMTTTTSAEPTCTLAGTATA